MAKFRLNQGQQKVLTTLAYILSASNISKILEDTNPNCKGFFEFYLANALDNEQRAIWEAFNAEAKKAYKDISKELEKEFKTKQ